MLCHLAFFAPTSAFKPLAYCMPWRSFSSRSFSLRWRSLYVSWISELLIMSMSFEPSISTFFFRSDLPTLFTTLRVLSVDVMSRLNVILTVSGIITWSLEPCGISISMCWLQYAMHVDFGYMFSFAFEGILRPVLPWDLILRKYSWSLFHFFFTMIFCCLWWRLQNFKS